MDSLLTVLTNILYEAVIPLVLLLALASLIFGIYSLFSFKRSDLPDTASEQLRTIPSELLPYYALIREYHAQGLSQSRVSFWFSLIFASAGFFIIAYAVILYMQEHGTLSTWAGLAKPTFVLVAATVIEVVSSLFLVLSTKATESRSDFFDKLRVDRKIEESLKLVGGIGDTQINSNLRALLAIKFAEITIEKELYESVLLTRPEVI